MTSNEPAPAPVRFIYRNHRGEVATRHVIVLRFSFGESEWHPGPQVFLHAYDLDRRAERAFALKDIIG